jgi:FixJ family two-component response regulator
MYELDMTPKGAFYRTWPRLAAQGSSGAVTALGLPWLVDRVHLSQRGKRMTKPIVAVVDDDESVRESLPDLLGEIGFEGRAFASAREFLEYDRIADSKCLILDISMPEMSGPELEHELIQRGYVVPTIFMTARSKDSLPADLFQRGAVQCLFKPFSGPVLWAALNAALGKT